MGKSARSSQYTPAVVVARISENRGKCETDHRRAGRIKTNRSKLKKTVHDPVLDARMQRLSDKLLEIAQSNKTGAP